MRDGAGTKLSGVVRTDLEQPILCWRCGYELGGIRAEGACPECGEAVVESLPERKVGTVWQNLEGDYLVSWMRTDWEMLRRPASMFKMMRFDDHRQGELLVLNISLGGVLVGAALFAGQQHRVDQISAVFIQILFISGTMVLWTMIMYCLSFVETLGIRFGSKVRKRRISGSVASVIVDHASVGWLIGAMLIAVGVGLQRISHVLEGMQMVDDALLLWKVGLVVWIVGGVAGLLVFETLVYIGVKACRYSNLDTGRASVRDDVKDDQPERTDDGEG